MPKQQVPFVSRAGKNLQSQLSSGRDGRCLPQGTVKAELSERPLEMHRANEEAAELCGSPSSSHPFADNKLESLLCTGKAPGVGGCRGTTRCLLPTLLFTASLRAAGGAGCCPCGVPGMTG